MMKDISSRGLWTVRVTTLLIGALVGAERVSTDRVFAPEPAISAGVFLFLAIALGFITYHETDIVFGPDPDYLADIAMGGYADWGDHYLGTMTGWIDINKDQIRFNSYLLLASQISFVLGLLLAAVAALI